MNQAAADMFAKAFTAGALYHPGDQNRPSGLLPLPGFRSAGMTDEQAAEMIGETAKLWGEALAHHVEASGKSIIDTAELAQLRQDAADAPDGIRVIRVHRGNTNGPVAFELTIGKGDDAAMPEVALRALGMAS